MYRKIMLSFIVMGAGLLHAAGQEITIPDKLSLKEAQQIALKNNPGLQASTINTAIAQKQAEQARMKKIPDIYANYDLRRNLIIPTTPVPAKAFNPNAPEGELMPLKFSTKWTSNTGLNATFDLFNPQTHGQVKEALQQAAISETDKRIAANNLQYQVAEDYAACLIAQKQLELAIADTVAQNKVLSMSKDQYAAGRLKVTDLNQVEAEKSGAISNYLKAVKIKASAISQLLSDMGLDPTKEIYFSFTDSLPNLLKEYKNSADYEAASLSLKKWQQQEGLTHIQLSNTRSGFLPTISLNSFYGGNYFDNDFDLFNDKNWYGNSYVGLSLTIPITQGLDRIKKIEALRLQAEADQANYRAQQNQLQLEKTQAVQDLAFKEKDLSNKEKGMALAQQNLQTATEQFSAGRLLSGDLAQSNFLYQQAKVAYLQAAYDFILAKMALEKLSTE